MSDPDTTTTTPTPPPDQMETKPQNDTAQDPKKLTNISLRIWPPTQRTRDAVITRLIETLSEPSVLSKRYGSMSSEEAEAAARTIEDEAFAVAGAAASAEDDGIEILQVYSKEISKRMLEAIKSKANANSSASNTAPPSVDDSTGAAPAAAAGPAASEDVISSAETEA